MRQYLEYDPVIGWRFIPGIRARIPHEGGGYLIRANELGFRSDVPFVSKQIPGRRRALLFGDSFTAGDGVSNGQRFCETLENLLPNLEIFNFGLPATGPDQHFLLSRLYAPTLEHDLVIIAICVENIRRVISRYRPFVDETGRTLLYEKPVFELDEAGQLLQKGVPPSVQPVDPRMLAVQDQQHVYKIGRYPSLRKLYTSIMPRHPDSRTTLDRLFKERFQRMFSYQPFPEYDDPTNHAWRTLRAILLDWVTQQQRPVIIAPLPLIHHVLRISDSQPYLERFAEVAEASGAALVDPLPALLSYSDDARRNLFYVTDCHPTRVGHEVLAKALAPAVSKTLDGVKP